MDIDKIRYKLDEIKENVGYGVSLTFLGSGALLAEGVHQLAESEIGMSVKKGVGYMIRHGSEMNVEQRLQMCQSFLESYIAARGISSTMELMASAATIALISTAAYGSSKFHELGEDSYGVMADAEGIVEDSEYWMRDHGREFVTSLSDGVRNSVSAVKDYLNQNKDE